ncbi:hypothetical protein [Filimonas effusa]|uniref:Uncharacterized protein n=1 Tax=Filimonas effusa TaxID=2508721 RepID=A0A4Q1D3H7_9BACT|nr:hypothetical protein [Filimonas effusa]RXK82925.1 hypothetical protein ESB13_12415 [Filimonas effusa]
MSEQLNLKRLGLLIRNHWWENGRLYVLGIVSLIGLLAIVFGIAVVPEITVRSPFERNSYFQTAIIGLYVSGVIFASASCLSISGKTKRIYWFMLPASHLEKLLTLAFYTMIVFPIVYMTCYLGVQELVIALLPADKVAANETLVSFLCTRNDIEIIIPLFFGFQSFFLMGSIYFQRFGFIKTVIACAICMLLFVALMTKTQEMLAAPMPAYKVDWNGIEVVKRSQAFVRIYTYPDWIKILATVVASTAWAPAFLLVAWFRLKEREV